MHVGMCIDEAIRSLCSSKQRSALALMGIVIGIGSVIAMVSVGRMVQNEALQQFKDMGTDIINVEKEAPDSFAVNGDNGGGSGARTIREKRSAQASLKPGDIMAIPQYCPAISLVAPFAVLNGGVFSHDGKRLERTSLLGVTESFRDMNKLHVRSGRFLSDLDENSRFCVVGGDIGNEMHGHGSGNVIGENIRVGENIFSVIGVIDEVPERALRLTDPNISVYIHISTALRIFGNAEITSVAARVRPGFDNAEAGRQVTGYFAARTRSPSVRISSPEDLVAALEKQMRTFTLMLGAIGGISLVVGGIGVMNVMLVSVSERRREIGIRRALGARPRDILGQFLIESLVLTTIGGLFGVIAGIGCSRIISYFAHWRFLLSFDSIVLGVAVSSAAGIFFGMYPARRASLLDPVAALRSE